MSEKISLALSGGGSRAMAFHAGVLKYFAEMGMLENVVEISSVSGGSLLTGLIFTKSGMRWPTSQEYLSKVFPQVRTTLTTTSIQASAAIRLLSPRYWQFLGSLPNLVARAMYMDWRVRGVLDDLPRSPVWSINCTTAENGRRFRFKEGRLGDYESGYAEAGQFPLASAMAVSAAFPVGIGPFRLYAGRLTWWKRHSWGAKTEENIEPPSRNLHLYDGGVYDNLGLEPLFNINTSSPHKAHRVIVLDAGAPLWRGFGLSSLNPLRIKRLMDVMMDQNRALRVRGFIKYVILSQRGGYLGIVRTKNIRDVIDRQRDRATFLSDESATRVASFPTSLGKLNSEDFDLIACHGYETAKLTQIGYPYLPSHADSFTD
jgi:NTE family protein